MTQIKQSFIITATTHKAGKGELRSASGNTPVGVVKKAGNFYITVDGSTNGLNRSEIVEAWDLLADYLGASLTVDPTFGKPVKKTKRKPEEK